MMKYFAIFLLILSVGIYAQSGQQTVNPLDSLDSPIEETQDGKKVKMEFGSDNSLLVEAYTNWTDHGWNTFWSGNPGVLNALNFLANLASHNGSFWSPGYVGNSHLNQFINDLSEYLAGFPQSSEITTMTAGAGDTVYVDEFGQSVSADLYNGTADSNPSERNIEFYAGRNTAVGGAHTTDMSTIIANSPRYHQLSVTFSNPGNQDVTYNVYAFGAVTPIVLDMDGDNKLEASGGQWLPHSMAKGAHLILFDMNGDGFEEYVEWVGANDGLLMVYDKEGTSGKNLFGNAGGFADGFEKLSSLDKNVDKKLTGQELASLSVWQDKNRNGITDKGEVNSVVALGITEIQTSHNVFVSSFVQNGQTKRMWDWHPVSILVKKEKK
jgi:hypothetical protein